MNKDELQSIEQDALHQAVTEWLAASAALLEASKPMIDAPTEWDGDFVTEIQRLNYHAALGRLHADQLNNDGWWK